MMKYKPFIAIAARCEMRDNIQWVLTTQAFFRAVTLAGGIPVMIYHECTKDYHRIAEAFDGLLIPGGDDINPALYHQKKYTVERIASEQIDQLDIQLIHVFHDIRKPILGICRGMQCINVAFGGTLIQDIAAEYNYILSADHDQRKIKGITDYENTVCHEITCMPDTELFSIYGEKDMVNSFHHQCIDQLAKGFMPSAYSKNDNIIEGIEMSNILGVQWHPEWLLKNAKSLALFQHFIDKATNA